MITHSRRRKPHACTLRTDITLGFSTPINNGFAVKVLNDVIDGLVDNVPDENKQDDRRYRRQPLVDGHELGRVRGAQRGPDVVRDGDQDIEHGQEKDRALVQVRQHVDEQSRDLGQKLGIVHDRYHEHGQGDCREPVAQAHLDHGRQQARADAHSQGRGRGPPDQGRKH
eukprot:scaffold5291_cov129-Isochrysis_galbana.AAC.3